MTITAAVDGSSLGNPGPAGWAWVISVNEWDAGGWPSGTNNMGELTAVLKLFEATAAAGRADEPLVILADSQYAINCISKWMPGWKRRGWRKADGQPVANRDILEDLDRAIAGRKYRFEWVKGHAGHSMNELADKRARAASEAYQAGRTIPRGPGLRGVESPVGVEAGAVEVVQAPPIEVINADEARERWAEVVDAAANEPVTILRQGAAPLLLLDAERGRLALAALSKQERSVETEQSLF